MKWGRKNASSQPSLITHVFPASWFSKFKQKKGNFEPMSAKAKQKKVQEGSPSSSSLQYAPWKEGRFYCGDDDPDWRLSFGDEGAERSKAWRNSAWDDDDPQVSIPNSGSSNMEAFWMFNDMASSSDVKNAREIQEKAGNSLQDEKFGRFNVSEECRKKTVKDQRSKKLKRRAFQEKREELANTTERAMFEVQPKKIIHATRDDVSKSVVSESRYRRSFSFPNSNLRTIEEDCILKTLNLETSNAFPRVVEEEEEINLQCNRLEDMKIKEMMLKTDQERGSVHIERNSVRKRRKQISRSRCYSPRTAAKIECKIRAIEDMKKAKTRKMKSKESTTSRDASVFESYAVAKSSFNPQKDFRDSMIEMIMEKGIQTPEELEQLLACYLTLNYDEYHDLIIKVFRQVYFELNQMYFASELQHYVHCHD